MLDRRGVLVLKIAKLREEIYTLSVHLLDTFAKLVERIAVIACADGIGVGVVTVGNNAESYGPWPASAADWTGAGKLCQSQPGKSRRRGFQKNPPGNYPVLLVEIFVYRPAFLNERYCGSIRMVSGCGLLELLHFRQVFKRIEAEDFEELFCCSIQHRPAQDFGAADYLD